MAEMQVQVLLQRQTKHSNMKTKNKTVRQWIDTLPKELRDEIYAVANFGGWGDYEPFLSAALLGSVYFFATESGHDFWQSFYEALLWAEMEDAK